MGEKSLRHWSHFKTWISPLSFYYKEQSTANERMFFVVGKHFPTSKQACYFVHARFKYRVYFCGFGYVLCFRFTILSPFDRPLFWEVCPVHSVSAMIMHVFSLNLAFFYTVIAVLVSLLQLSPFLASISPGIIRFNSSFHWLTI